MPEINPITKDQLFEKKIAENTGSDYNVDDISDVVPVTKDQALLKEIALNSAGQARNITELEGKVADNTSAIEALVNVNGACNLCPTSATTTTDHGITFTVNSDGSITASGTADSGHVATIDIMPKTDLSYGTYKGSGGVNEHCRIIYGLSNSSGTLIDTVDDSGEGIELTVNASTPKVSMALIIDKGTDLTTPITFYPMLYDARLNPTGYVPYAMTNRELTERVEVKLLSNERLIIEKCGRVVHVSTFRHVAVDDVSTTIIPYEYRPKNDIYGAMGLYDGSTDNYSACTGVIRSAGNIQAVTSNGNFYSGSDYQIVFSFTYIV